LNYLFCFCIEKPPTIHEPEPEKEPPRYVPPESKPWISAGSDLEINEQHFTDNRPLVSDITETRFEIRL
jgi:hypothetical protein